MTHVTFHHYWADPKLAPILMSGYSPKEAPCFEHLLGIKLTPDLKWNVYIWCHHKRGLKNGWFLVSLKENTKNSCCYALYLQGLDQTKNGLLLPYLGCQALTETKSNYVALWLMNYFLPCNYYCTDKMLPASHYFITNTIVDVQKLHSLLPPADLLI